MMYGENLTMRLTKRITALFLGLTFVLVGTKVSAVNEFSWYVKKNGHELPKFPEIVEKLYMYDAYCVDYNRIKNSLPAFNLLAKDFGLN